MRRISTWEKGPAGDVRGKALQDLGYDCFAVYCTAFVYEVPRAGWNVVIERAGFYPQTFQAPRRFEGMMLAEAMIARQWSEAGILRLVAANPEAFRDSQPGAVPVTDCKKFPFWKPKPVPGPKPEPAYMKLLTPEHIFYAKLPSGVTYVEDVAVWRDHVNEELASRGLEPLDIDLERDYGEDKPEPAVDRHDGDD